MMRGLVQRTVGAAVLSTASCAMFGDFELGSGGQSSSNTASTTSAAGGTSRSSTSSTTSAAGGTSTTSSSCIPGAFLNAGESCTADSQCCSGACGINNCCATACNTSDPVCGAVACDSVKGACEYPLKTMTCGGQCANGVETLASTCNGSGLCQGATVPCAPYVCSASACKTSCTQKSDCMSGYHCDGTGACVTQTAPGGTCAANDECSSGVCDVKGSGRCCTKACDTSDATCGATSCDPTGACVYPSATKACGAASCTNGVETLTSACDGSGRCNTQSTTPCASYACGPTACKTSCTQDSDCAVGP